MDVDQQVFVFEVGPGEVDEEGPEGEVYLGLIGAVKEVKEGPVVFDLPLVLLILLQVRLVRLQQFVAYLF